MNDRILRRSESYVGLHFDMHANEHELLAGEEAEEKIAKMLEEIQPDYVQCDAKGHPGVASFKTKYGPTAQFKGENPLKVWRRVTKKYNTALYAHYSGVFDIHYIKHFNAGVTLSEEDPRKGLDEQLTSFYSNYLEEKMLPQLKEIAETGLDGVWVDGDSWAAYQDYRDEAFEEFTAKTGITEIPQKKGDAHFSEWIDFFRGKFKAFLKRYVDELHREYPEFQLCSNWMYTMYAPEPVDVDVDFLSGDYPCLKSVVEARSHARCIALQNKPWDLMAWGFVETAKPAVMLCQEAAVTLALGGGIEFYYPQNRDGTIKTAFIKPFKEAIAFCRERQKWCQDSKSASEIAIFLSKRALYDDMIQPFTPRRADVENLDGALKCVLEAGFSADIAAEHQLIENKDRYKLIIVPEWGRYSDESMEFLKEFAKSGGSILVVGTKAAEEFADVCGITLGENEQGNVYIPQGENVACGIGVNYRKIISGNCLTKASDREEQGEEYVIASETVYGRGKIFTVSADIFSMYNNIRSCYIRDYISSLIEKLLPNPSARICGTHFVDLTLQEKEGKTYPNLVNISGFAHTTDSVVYDEITPLYNFEVKVKCDKTPEKVYMQPEGRELEFTCSDGVLNVKIDRLDIHGILDIVY